MTSETPKKVVHKEDIGGIIGCLAIIVFVVAWGILIYNGIHKSLNTDVVQLQAEVKYTDDAMTITNKDNFDWRYVWFSLDTDDNPDTYEYSYYLSKLEKKAASTINFKEFKKDDATYYEPAAAPPKNLSVFGQTSQGTGRFVYSFE